jgi:hypothetical protein
MELTLIETKFYLHNGMYWMVKGDKLVQFDYNYYVEYPSGNDVYSHYMRYFKKQIPLPEREATFILSQLKETINNIL